jgi:hypothetical protein
MDSRLYPQGKGGLKTKYNGSLLEFYDTSGNLVYAIDASSGDVIGGGVVNVIRTRATISTINGGFTLLAARPGWKYQLVSAAAIAYGGAVGAVTTVDLKGTQSTLKKLVAWAQASLTQSTRLEAGDSGAAILADGASYIACDANTALTVDITGSNCTTATGIDFIVEYVMVPA